MRSGIQFPAIDVFRIDDRYYLVDGFHRLQAAQKVGRENIHAEIHQGTIRDAIIFSAGTNTRHGIQRTNADKKRVVQRLLDDKEWSQWSNVAIANACQVSEHLVRSLRDLSSPGAKIPNERKVKRKGTTFTVKTENIGKNVTTSEQRYDDEVADGNHIPRPIAETTPSPAPIPGKTKGILLTTPIAPDTEVESPAPSIKDTAVTRGVSVNKPISNIPDGTVGSSLVHHEKIIETLSHLGAVVTGCLALPDEREKWFTDLMKCTFPAEDPNVIHELIQSGKFGHEMNLLSQVVQSVHCKLLPGNVHSLANKMSTLPECPGSGSKSEGC
jgi:hypothetical protein